MKLAIPVISIYLAILFTPALAQQDEVPKNIADSVGNAKGFH